MGQAAEAIKEKLAEANKRMLGKTNRAILFSKVNLDSVLNPDDPEEEQEMTPSLADMLARVMDAQEGAFLDEVRDKLTVTSFSAFLDKFQPGFYYRVRPPQVEETGDEDTYDAGGEAESDETAEGGVEVESTESAVPPPPPQLEFALTGGPGWKKVSITADHPYIKCLTELIRKRVRQDIATFRVDVDASLFAFRPRAQRALMRKLAEDVQVKYEKLALEAKRKKGSSDHRRALEAYNGAASEFQGALEDQIRVLPTVVYGLEQTAKEMKKLSPGGGPVDTNVYQIEFGTKRALVARPQQLPQLTGAGGPAALEAGSVEAKALEGGTEGDTSTELAKAEKTPETALAVRTVENALDKIREESHKLAGKDLATIPQEKRFPIVLAKFMDRVIEGGSIAPLMGNMVATVLNNPKELALLSPDIKDVEYFHDMFLGVYSNAIEDFLKTVTPLFETIMGIYLLFNEFPSDVRLPEEMMPELIIANADLPDLFLTRQEELKKFFEIANAQANNQFRDAISFVIVPNVAEFKKKRPKKQKQAVRLDDSDIFDIGDATGDDEETYGRVTFIDEMMGMMEWGQDYGFQVLFSPEERVRAGRTKRDDMLNLSDAYAIPQVVDKDFADCAILCLPDFVIMPPDGKLITGKTADGTLEVGVDVPELNVRACFIAAGRLMANDVPEYLRRKMMKLKKDPAMVRMDLPGVGINLAKYGYLGETNLPTDHFLNDGIVGDLLNPEMPFLVFTHVSGMSPYLSVPRTMRRVPLSDGSQSYRNLYEFRQLVYLNRLVKAAYALAFSPELPMDPAAAETEIMDVLNYIRQWTGWHNPDKFVNSFPSKLREKEEFLVQRTTGNTFKVALGFETGMSGALEFKF